MINLKNVKPETIYQLHMVSTGERGLVRIRCGEATGLKRGSVVVEENENRLQCIAYTIKGAVKYLNLVADHDSLRCPELFEIDQQGAQQKVRDFYDNQISLKRAEIARLQCEVQRLNEEYSAFMS
jgi:hypothetical protein